MPNIRFYHTNLWALGTISASSYHPNFPAANTQIRWKTRTWRSNYEALTTTANKSRGTFIIDANNRQVYFNEGGGNLNATLTMGNYTPTTLAAEIETQLEATGAHNYTVEYLDTGLFRITDDTLTVNLLLSNQTNAIWDTIGFTGVIDTGLLAVHTADELRIHTEDYLTVDCGAAILIYGVFVYVGNLTSSGVIKIQFSTDNFATISAEYTLVEGDTCWAYTWNHGMTYRYWRIHVSDPTNPDCFVELGLVFLGQYFEPTIGFRPKRTRNKDDNSLVSLSEGGQVSSIQRNKSMNWDYKFDLAEPKASWDAMYELVGTSLALVVLEKPSNPESAAFTNPENNAYYVRFSSWKEKHLAGQRWGVDIGVKEEL